MKYRTKEGDMLDDICWRFYGRQSEAVEVVLEANQDLGDQGEQLPAGLIIELPDLPASEKQSVKLWD